MIFDDEELNEQLGYSTQWSQLAVQYAWTEEQRKRLKRVVRSPHESETSRKIRKGVSIPCIACGTKVVANRNTRKFCSDACRLLNSRKQQRLRGLTSRGKPIRARTPGKTKEQLRIELRARYKNDPEFRRRRIDATIRWHQKRKAA